MDETVKKVAAAEPPPQAPSRKEVKENCQSWAVRVMKKLVESQSDFLLPLEASFRELLSCYGKLFLSH